MEGGPAVCPQVFVVDSQAPVTLMPSVVKRDFRKKKEYLLYLLVGLALLGVIIEAGFIFHLYKKNDCKSHILFVIFNLLCILQKVSAFVQGRNFLIASSVYNITVPTRRGLLMCNNVMLMLMCVVGGLRKNVDENGVMQWQTEGLGSFLHQVGYEDGRLLIQTEGFYYIHSKVYFSDSCSTFRHQVMWKTTRYREDTKLMQALRYSCVEGEPSGEKSADVGNSFLGGVFRLYKSDSVYVKVNESSLVRAGVQDNFFGVFMI
uniref:THD domain-containing protein n=1 Tax=Astyanax mexicanus TaxID=7994 RepID=A0A8B9HHU7_ASTMX